MFLLVAILEAKDREDLAPCKYDIKSIRLFTDLSHFLPSSELSSMLSLKSNKALENLRKASALSCFMF